jgi:hypothetical protein
MQIEDELVDDDSRTSCHDHKKAALFDVKDEESEVIS